MPDYNAAATTYWWSAVTLGSIVLLGCLARVLSLSSVAILQIAACTVFAVAAGMFPVRIPGTRVSFGVGELTIFLVLQLQGPAAATVLAAAEAAVGSWRSSKRWTSRLGSPAMATLAMFAASQLFVLARDALTARGFGGTVGLLALAMVIGGVYFVFSATLMGGVARLRRGEHLFQLGDLMGAFRWVGLAFSGSAMVATLLYLASLEAGAGVFWVTVPLLGMLLLVLRFFYREQEAQRALQAALAEIAEREARMQQREAEAAARHERELQYSERRFLGAFTYAAIGMVLLDLDGRVIQSNDALARMLGQTPEDLAGSGFAALLHPDDRDPFVARLSTARDVHFEDFEQDIRLTGAGGRPRAVRAHCSFFFGPATAGSAHAGKPCLMLQVQPIEWLASTHPG